MPVVDYSELFDAAEANDEKKVVHLFEEKQIPVTSTDWLEQTVGHIAAKAGNLNLVKYVLERDSSVLHSKDFYGNTIFFLAIEKGCFDMVTYLVESHKANILEPNNLRFGNTAIHVAAQFGHLNILKYFVEEMKCPINVKNRIDQPPVFVAAENKHKQIVQYLLEKNADLTIHDYRRCNILYIMVDTNNLDLMKYLIDEKKLEFDINWKDMNRLTLVHRAAILNRIDLLKYLVGEKHADVSIADQWGKTPLHSAARWNHYHICKYLIEHGANIEAKDDKGMTPLQEASNEYLINYMRESLQKRNRRSILFPTPRITTRIQGITKAPSIWSSGRLEGGVSTEVDVSSSQIESFLVVAQAIIKYGSGYQESRRRSFLSPRKIINYRIDPLAIDAVHTVPE